MPLTNLSDIEKQEKLFQQHISDFIKPRTENSTHPKECIELLRFRFSEKLGLSPRVNFFAFNSVKELREKRKEIEKIPNYEAVDKKINRYQPRAALNAYEKFLTRYGTDADLYVEEPDKELLDEIFMLNPLQQIFFGAPGTGKSHTIKSEYLVDVSEDNTFRTTFHPDYDYAQFVGSYKPKKENGTITYSFVPQVFAKAYKRAKETSEPVYLVIEEINRGNCAQIFGDIFQLLDRNESGESQYEIDVDSDFAEWLGESKIKLPPNFNILATMNTSDQSLFPMDSAFKRRFDWEYVPIRYVKDSKCGDDWNADKFEIKLDEHTSFSWLHFLKKINADIYKVTESEDKQMGEFFVKPKDGVIGLDMFRSKVLFYLWDSVYKDEPDKRTIFHFNYPEKNGSRVTFQSLFSDDANAIEIIKQMMKNLDKAYESKDDSEFKNFKIVSEQ